MDNTMDVVQYLINENEVLKRENKSLKEQVEFLKAMQKSVINKIDDETLGRIVAQNIKVR